MTPSEPIRAAGRRVADVLLSIGAGLGFLGMVTALAAVIFGIVPLVFTSGSMSPEIPTGSLGLARTVAASELRVGDVVSVTAANEIRVTHRIVATEQQSDLLVLTLKGDTNPSPDQESYSVTEADRVFFTTPHLGRVIMSLTSPWGMFLGGLAAAALLFWAFHRRPPLSADTGTKDDAQRSGGPLVMPITRHAHHTKTRTGATLMAVGISAFLLITSNSGTAAYWTDDATVTTTGFGTHRLLQPNEVTCTASTTGTSTLTVRTTPLVVGEPSRTDYTYWARAYDSSGGAVSGYKQMTLGSSPAATFDQTELTIAAGIDYTIRIHSRLRAPGPAGPTGETGWESELPRRVVFSLNSKTLACGQAIVPPVIVFTQPINGFNGDKDQLQALIKRDCNKPESPNSGVCGTAIDPNGTVASVQYSLRRTAGIGTYCWSGSGYPIGTASCAFRDADRVGDRWIIPGYVYPGIQGWNYTLTIRATDNLGAVSEKSISFRVRP